MQKGTYALHSFHSLLPQHQGHQSDLVEWILDKHFEVMKLQQLPDRERLKNVLKRFSVSEKQIACRYFETPREEIYQIDANHLSGADMGKRHQFFAKRAEERLRDFYSVSEVPDHLIHVTCTGYVSPSAPQAYFSDKTRIPDITHAYHMGCYASLPAVRIGHALALHKNQKIDLVHTEMCSLHLDPAQHSPEQMVVQTLFADGHIKYSLDATTSGRRLIVNCVKEKLIPGSRDDMTWIPSASSMQMTLSKEVPKKIGDHLLAFLAELATENGISTEDLLKNSHFAIHPGGPKIIDAIEEKLSLSPSQTYFSRKILLQRGNMSSATLPHVWKEILSSDYQGRVVSLAFGPGLTIFGGIFEATR